MSDVTEQASEMMFDEAKYAALVKQALRDLHANVSREKKFTFSDYTKDQIISFLKSPETNAASIRKASIQMYQNSEQYRRLISYHAYLPLWAYTLFPSAFNRRKIKPEAFQKQYYKAAAMIERMNLHHELRKALQIAYREGVLYGAIWANNTSWFIQRIDPDISVLSSIEDGTWMYAVDMSRIAEEDLFRYPPEFTNMHREYIKTGEKYQEVPSQISFCLKADETVSYPIPLFASVLPSIFDLENNKELADEATEIANYKLLAMKVPLRDDGQPSMPWQLVMQYYEHLANNLPKYVGVAAVPMDIKDINFEKSGVGQETDEVEQATRNFWYSTGTSPLLFGDATNTTAAALNLSIRTAEEIAFASMAQCERLINRHLKTLPGSIKFQINILPVTVFNQEKMIGYYKEASTYGLPVKLAYNAAIGIPPTTVEGSAYVENDVLHLKDIFVPLSSTHTESSEDRAGRPTLSDDDISEAGEQTREDDEDANKE